MQGQTLVLSRFLYIFIITQFCPSQQYHTLHAYSHCPFPLDKIMLPLINLHTEQTLTHNTMAQQTWPICTNRCACPYKCHHQQDGIKGPCSSIRGGKNLMQIEICNIHTLNLCFFIYLTFCMFQLTLFPWFIHCSLHLNFMASNLIINVGQVFLR